MGGHGHPPTKCTGSGALAVGQVGRLEHDVDLHRSIALVLHDDGQFEAVAVVGEARRRRPHGQRQAGGDVALRAAELVDTARGDHHHPVAGEVVGQGQLDTGRPVGGSGDRRLEQCQRIEVRAHGHRRTGAFTTSGRLVASTGRRQCEVRRARRRRRLGRGIGVGRTLVVAVAAVAGQPGRVDEADLLTAVHSVRPFVPAGIEQAQRVGEGVAREREHRLVDNDHRELGALHRHPVRILHGDVDRGRLARRQLSGTRRGHHIEHARRRRNRQVQRPDGVGRAQRSIGGNGAVVVRTLRGTHHFDAEAELRDVGLQDRHAHHRAAVLHLEAQRAADAVAADRDQALAARERRLHEQLGGVAGRILGLVGHDRERLLVDATRGLALRAADPGGQFAAVTSTGRAGDHRCHPVLTTDGRVELAGHGVVHGGDGARLRVEHDLRPLTIDVLRLDAAGDHLERDAGDDLTVDAGHDRVDRQRVALTHERARGAQPHVAIGRVHQQIGVRGPCLTVHIGDRRLCRHRHRQVGQHAVLVLEIDLQVMGTVGARRAAVGLHIRFADRPAARAAVVARIVDEAATSVAVPPRDPHAEGEAVPTGRRVGGGRGADHPIDRRVGQRAARVVRTAGGDRHRLRADVRALALRTSGDLELGAPVLLDPELVVVAAAQLTGALQLQVERSRTEVRGLRERQVQIEATQRTQCGDTFEQLVPVGVGDRVAHGRAGRQRLQLGGAAERVPAHPPLHAHRLAGAVHLAVVEHEPTGFVVHVLAVRLRQQDRCVVAAGCHHDPAEVARRRGQSDGRKTVAVGGARGTAEDADIDARQRCSAA